MQWKLEIINYLLFSPCLHSYYRYMSHQLKLFRVFMPLLIQINAEFKRITTMPLQSRFLSQLDMLSDKLIKLFENRGGQIGKRLKSMLARMTEVRKY